MYVLNKENKTIIELSNIEVCNFLNELAFTTNHLKKFRFEANRNNAVNFIEEYLDGKQK